MVNIGQNITFSGLKSMLAEKNTPVVAVVMVVMAEMVLPSSIELGGAKQNTFFLFVDQKRKKNLKKTDLEYLNFRALSP